MQNNELTYSMLGSTYAMRNVLCSYYGVDPLGAFKRKSFGNYCMVVKLNSYQ